MGRTKPVNSRREMARPVIRSRSREWATMHACKIKNSIADNTSEQEKQMIETIDLTLDEVSQAGNESTGASQQHQNSVQANNNQINDMHPQQELKHSKQGDKSILGDRVNEQQNQNFHKSEMPQKKRPTLQTFLQEIEDNETFQCNMCFGRFQPSNIERRPILFLCGEHTACFTCCIRWYGTKNFSKSQKCIICKTPGTGPLIINRTLEKWQKLVELASNELDKAGTNRTRSRNQRRKKTDKKWKNLAKKDDKVRDEESD